MFLVVFAASSKGDISSGVSFSTGQFRKSALRSRAREWIAAFLCQVLLVLPCRLRRCQDGNLGLGQVVNQERFPNASSTVAKIRRPWALATLRHAFSEAFFPVPKGAAAGRLCQSTAVAGRREDGTESLGAGDPYPGFETSDSNLKAT